MLSTFRKLRSSNRKSLRGHDRRGATTVEFAIVVPLFLLFLFAFFELGRALMIDSVIENAAYEGARRGIIPGATAQSVFQAAREIAETSDVRSTQVAVLPGNITPETEFITVTVSTPLSESGLVIGSYLMGREIERSVTMTREPKLREQFRPQVIHHDVPSTPKPRGRGKGKSY